MLGPEQGLNHDKHITQYTLEAKRLRGEPFLMAAISPAVIVSPTKDLQRKLSDLQRKVALAPLENLGVLHHELLGRCWLRVLLVKDALELVHSLLQ